MVRCEFNKTRLFLYYCFFFNNFSKVNAPSYLLISTYVYTWMRWPVKNFTPGSKC